MKETSAKNTKGYILYSPFRENKYFFRVYQEDGKYKDYDLNIEELEIEILSEHASFYEENGKNKLDFSSKVLGK